MQPHTFTVEQRVRLTDEGANHLNHKYRYLHAEPGMEGTVVALVDSYSPRVAVDALPPAPIDGGYWLARGEVEPA